MKNCGKFARNSIVLTLALFSTFFSGQAFGGEVREVADGVYYYSGGPDDSPQNSFAANVGIIVGEDGILVVDTLTSSKTAGALIERIREISDKPIRYVVNTHGHIDHAYGNCEFEKLGTVIVAHCDCRDYLEKTGEATLGNTAMYNLTEDDMTGTRIAYPSLTFTDKMRVDLGGREVELLNLGPSHSPGSIAVFLPNEKIVFTGDILFTDFHPFLAEGDLNGWQKALDAVKALGPSKIIPGHGPVSDESDIDDMKEYLTAFDDMARELVAESDDPEYISSELLKSLPERKMGKYLVKFNIQMKYLNNE